MDTSDKSTSGPGSGPRKFTLSCSRCRASKLKCDQKEPCLECIKRNVGHLCAKDERQPRAKKAKTNHNAADNTIANTQPNQDSDAEEAAKLLEHFVDGTYCTSAHQSAIPESSPSVVAPDYANTYWSNQEDLQRQGEKMALIRDVVHAVPELDIIRSLYEVFVTRCQGPLGNVIHTPTFTAQAETLYNCLALDSIEARKTAVSNTIPLDLLACHLLALVLALAFHPRPSLLGWVPGPQSFRVEELRRSDDRSKKWRSLALRCLYGGVSLFCGSIASLQAAIMLLLDGQEESLALDGVLVTAISGSQKLGLHHLGNAKLGGSALSCSSETGSSTLMESALIRTEVGIRIWWTLVMRDWSHGQSLYRYSINPSHFNTRMPLHINDEDLCSPVLRADDRGYITERPRSEFTMLSYTVYALEIAAFARESIDLSGPVLLRQGKLRTDNNEGLKMRNYLNKRYENFVAGLPSYFRLGSTVGLTSSGPMAAIPVQRWMLHQQLWSLFLRLHRASLSSQDGRASCQLMAQNIISNQAHIQVRCAVCGTLSTNKNQLFNAAVVLLLDLLLSPRQKDSYPSSAQLSQLMTKDKILEAMELLRTQNGIEVSHSVPDNQLEQSKATIQRSLRALEELMKLEEELGKGNEYDAGKPTSGHSESQNGVSENPTKKSLKDKVKSILGNLQGNARNMTRQMTQADSDLFSTLDMSMPLSVIADGYHDLDVLPLLSDNLTDDLWQFLDFPSSPQSSTDNGSYSTSGDLQSLLDSMPLSLSSGAPDSLSSFGTPEFVDAYSTLTPQPVRQ